MKIMRRVLDSILIVFGITLMLGPWFGLTVGAQPTQSTLLQTYQINQLSGEVKDLQDQKLNVRVAVLETIVAQEHANGNWTAAATTGTGANLVGLVAVFSYMRRRLPPKE